VATPFPLGRHVQHDPRSRGFPAPRAVAVASVVHHLYGRPLNQGMLGSCTGNALTHTLNTLPRRQRPWKTRRVRSETDAINVYKLATELDDVPGTYPPQDTGSTGLAVCKAGQQLGLLDRYDHAFGLDHLLGAVQEVAVIVGTNWYQGMFTPDADGFVAPGVGDTVAGGHEYAVLGVDVQAEFLWLVQSWGIGWGVTPPWAPGSKWAGFFKLRFPVMERLLGEDGDCTVPVPKGQG
jgi:hypothetical protein